MSHLNWAHSCFFLQLVVWENSLLTSPGSWQWNRNLTEEAASQIARVTQMPTGERKRTAGGIGQNFCDNMWAAAH